MKRLIHFLMLQPFFYILVQNTIAGGGHKVIKNFLKKNVDKKANVLDQGCGTGEYSLLFKGRYTGIDNNRLDIKYAQQKYKGNFEFGDAAKMVNFQEETFGVVFAVGLHHHLSDHKAKQAINEAVRVCKKGGRIIVIDAMLPKNKLNLIGFILRKLDRGGHVRKFGDTLKLFPGNIKMETRILSSWPLDYVTIIIDSVKS